MAMRTKAILNSSRVNSQTIFIAFVGLALLATLACCQLAPAQDASKFKQREIAAKYRVELLEIDADAAAKKSNRSDFKAELTAIKDDRNKIRAALKSNAAVPGQLLTEYLEGYEFPAMTQTDSRIISKLGENRTKFMKDYLHSGVTGNTRRAIIDLTIKAMVGIYADKDLHPAVRLNAIYLLGQLDDVPADRSSNKNQPPEPSQAALARLMEILSSNDVSAAPEFAKIAALAGIQRHLQIEKIAGGTLDAGTRQALLTQIANTLKLTNLDNQQLIYWKKRRSMQLAGLIGDAGVLDAAIDILNSDEAGLWLQLDAVEAIGRLNLDTSDPAKKMNAALAITKFLAQAFNHESDFIEAAIDKLVFDSILYQDVDLKASGTSYEDDTPAATNGTTDANSNRGKGASGSGKFSGGGMGGIGGPGEGAGGEGGGGQGGGAGAVSVAPGSKFNLPNYQLDNIRRRIKSLAITGKIALGVESENSGLRTSITPEGQAFVDKVVTRLDDILKKSNAGIVDRDRRERSETDDDDDSESATDTLKQLCQDSGEALAIFARNQEEEVNSDQPDTTDDGN